MTHVLAGLEADFLTVLPRLGSLARVPGALQHHAVALVGVCVRPAHRVGGESVDRQVKTWLRRIAFKDGGLHAKFVAFGRSPFELVDVGADELARRERAELRL